MINKEFVIRIKQYNSIFISTYLIMTAQTSIYGPDFAPVGVNFPDRPSLRKKWCPCGDMCRTNGPCLCTDTSGMLPRECPCGDACSYGRSCAPENSPMRNYRCDMVCSCGNNCQCNPNWYSLPFKLRMMQMKK